MAAGACGGDDDGSAEHDAAPDADAGADASPEIPGQVTGLTASYSGPCDRVALTWTNPGASFAGVLVARSIGAPVGGVPVDGTSYTAGDELPTGGTVVYVGSEEAFEDTDGRYHGDEVHYAAYAFNSAEVYNGPAVATPVTVDQTLGAQTGQLSIDLVADTVAVTGPASFTLVGTSTYDEGSDTVTLEVDVTNGACRAVHQLKVLADAVGEGTADGDVDYDGTPALHLGEAALADGESRASTFTITGVTGAVDPLVVDISLIDHPSLLVPADWEQPLRVLDSSGTGVEAAVDAQALGYAAAGAKDSGALALVVSPDGELVYAAARNQPMVVTVDLTTLTAVGGADLTGANGVAFDATGTIGHVSALAMSPDYRYLYALLVTGDHHKFVSGDIGGRVVPASMTVDVDLVRLDRATLAEVDRVSLVVDGAGRPRPGVVGWAADGSRAAVPMMRAGQVFLVDLVGMTVVDGDGDTAGTQPFDVSASGDDPHIAAVAPGGATVALSYRGRTGDELDLLSVADGTLTPLLHETPTAASGRSAFVAFGPDGRLYHGRKDADNNLSIFDLTGLTEVELYSDVGVNGIVFDAARSRYIVRAIQQRITVFDIDTDIPVPFPATGDGQYDVADQVVGHHIALTPL